MIRFADCTLDVETRRLFRRDREVHLSAKSFTLLKFLIESRPRAVSKSELFERLWPGVFVSDASLAKVVSTIRGAIGDDRDTPIIRTVHRYGYAFAAVIEGEAPRAASAPAFRPVCWLFCGSREFPLRDGEHVMGRDANVSICLDSPRVSRRHARLIVNGRSATLEDLGSKNGSFVRGVRVLGPTALESGDDVRVGPFTLIFQPGADSVATASEVR